LERWRITSQIEPVCDAQGATTHDQHLADKARVGAKKPTRTWLAQALGLDLLVIAAVAPTSPTAPSKSNREGAATLRKPAPGLGALAALAPLSTPPPPAATKLFTVMSLPWLP